MNDEIINLKGSSWVIPGPTNIGIVEVNNGVYLIDSGNDKESGRKINKIITTKNWKLSGIINTHSNADHIGGNDYLQRMYNCEIFASQTEKSFIESPVIEASFLWGGFPVKELKNKFFEAKPSKVTNVITEQNILSGGIKVLSLPGHFFEMIGIITNDNVCYLGDCMFGESTLKKYKIPFIYDISGFKKTIEKIKTIKMDYFVMSHGNIETDITEIADENMLIVEMIENKLLEIVHAKTSFEDILKKLCDETGIDLNCGQYALIGSTVRSFLSYLYNADKIQYEFIGNKLFWSNK
jgi:glyoxylase-like metal-dependent hydrolase (beta-lactamase superfamily II)